MSYILFRLQNAVDKAETIDFRVHSAKGDAFDYRVDK
jgi:hypothetical protein